MLYKRVFVALFPLHCFLIAPRHGGDYYVSSNTQPNIVCEGTDTCNIYCDSIGLNTVTFNCGNTAECNFHCDETKCASGQLINASNADDLFVITTNGDECLKNTYIYTPDNGNATFIMQSNKGFKNMHVISGTNTQNIIIKSNSTINSGDECKDMEIDASTADYLDVTVSNQNEIENVKIICPTHTGSDGLYKTRCFINLTDAVMAGTNTITAPYGIPYDVNIECADPCDRVKIKCDSIASLNNLQIGTAHSIGDCYWTEEPTIVPTIISQHPTNAPTVPPSNHPVMPTINPTLDPTFDPTVGPTVHPTVQPTQEPSVQPTMGPTVQPTQEPTIQPTHSQPTTQPTHSQPTAQPTTQPTEQPTLEPVHEPTNHLSFPIVSTTFTKNTENTENSEVTVVTDEIHVAKQYKGVNLTRLLMQSLPFFIGTSVAICFCLCLICIVRCIIRSYIIKPQNGRNYIIGAVELPIMSDRRDDIVQGDKHNDCDAFVVLSEEIILDKIVNDPEVQGSDDDDIETADRTVLTPVMSGENNPIKERTALEFSESINSYNVMSDKSNNPFETANIERIIEESIGSLEQEEESVKSNSEERKHDGENEIMDEYLNLKQDAEVFKRELLVLKRIKSSSHTPIGDDDSFSTDSLCDKDQILTTETLGEFVSIDSDED